MSWRNTYNPFTKTWEFRYIKELDRHPASKAKETCTMYDDPRPERVKAKIRSRANWRRMKARLWALLPGWVHLLRGAD